MRHQASIGLGSNIEPERHLRAAVVELEKLGEIEAVSPVYASIAIGDTEQPDFLNAAVRLLTEHSADSLCESLREIEADLGRVRDPQNKNAARTIDLDLVLFDDAKLKVGHRRIPDPDILVRSFLAVPLAEIDRESLHPETGETLGEIAERVKSTGTQLQLRSEIDLWPNRSTS